MLESCDDVKVFRVRLFIPSGMLCEPTFVPYQRLLDTSQCRLLKMHSARQPTIVANVDLVRGVDQNSEIHSDTRGHKHLI